MMGRKEGKVGGGHRVANWIGMMVGGTGKVITCWKHVHGGQVVRRWQVCGGLTQGA